MLQAGQRATRHRTGSATGGGDLSVFGARTGSASGRAGEISSGLEAGVIPEAWGRGISPDHLGPLMRSGRSKARASRKKIGLVTKYS